MLTGQSATQIRNDKTGWILATSAGGEATGRGDRLYLDDPNNVVDTESDTIRDKTNRWFTEAMTDRLNDILKSVIIVIQQRTHEDDVSGQIIAKNRVRSRVRAGGVRGGAPL